MTQWLMAYAWEDTDSADHEVKFGEHWVADADDSAAAIQDTMRYIRGTLARQKYKFDLERIIVHRIWDVSDYARWRGKFYQHSKVDDVIRQVLSHRIGRSEAHRMHPDDLVSKVNVELARHGQALPLAGLSTYQHLVASEVLSSFDNGNRIVLADLCARFGKTLWAGVVAKESQSDLVVVACYVKTAFSSFIKDLTSFNQFADVVHVNTQELGWKKKVTDGLANGSKVFAYLSLANGKQRQDRLDWLFSIEARRLLVVDEADYGAHQPKQTVPMIKAVRPDDRVILMTGTNPDRAASTWKLDATPISVTYPELLMQKHGGSVVNTRSLAGFGVNPIRDKLVPDMRCYQMDLKGAVEQAIAAAEIADEDFKLLPSWSKFAAHPTKSKGFFTRMLQAVFLGQHGMDELNVDLQTGSYLGRGGAKVAMMFVPSNTRIENLKTMASIASQALPAWDVLPLSGGIKIDGFKVTNANAESFTKGRVETNRKQNRSTLIIASQIAQRSFSIPEMTELYLAYDKGEVGSTIQKISRVLTPGALDKIGRIISLSFDPNRDDKFDSMIIETAMNYKQRTDKKSIIDALSDVLRTVDIFNCTGDGAVRIDVNTYLAKILERDTIGRVIGKTADLTKLSDDDLLALSQGNDDYFRNAEQEASEKGKTKDGTGTPGKSDTTIPPDDRLTLLQKVREVIVALMENMDIIILGTNSDTLEDAMAAIDGSDEYKQSVKAQFGVDHQTIRYLFNKGAVKREWLEFKYDRR